MAALLDVRGLKAYYGQTQALHGIDFELEQGGITTILGANGAGKTTTLRSVCAMIRTEGEITFAGDRIDGSRTETIVRRGIGHVPDGRGTFVRLSVEENLTLAAITRRDKDGVDADFERVFGYFPVLRERRQQQAGTLSGGEQQMLAIARALMLRPRLMLLDEPSFGLAPLIVKEIFNIMQRINQEDASSWAARPSRSRTTRPCAGLTSVTDGGPEQWICFCNKPSPAWRSAASMPASRWPW